MKLLLDTHALLWFLDDDPRLSTPAQVALSDANNERWLSPISLLEIAVKVRLGKLKLRAPFAAMFPGLLVANHIQLVAIDSSHAEKVATMPLHHRDPFDRLIVAQTLIEQMTVVSVDSAFDAYVQFWTRCLNCLTYFPRQQ